MSRYLLRIKAFCFRVLQSILTMCDLFLSRPIPLRPSFTRSITSSIGNTPGSIDLLFYAPPSSAATKQKYPLLINFHGGGFTIGHAGDDARWATEVVKRTSAVVVSVNYRLAPEYPFPVGIEDCVAAVLWIWQHADEFNVDISRTAFSGFSAGGNLTFTVALRLHDELKRMEAHGELMGQILGKIVHLVAFYPSTDWTRSRAERDASNPNLIPVIPATLYKLFDESYLYPLPDFSSPLLSPGLAPDALLRDALPDRLVIINCSGDQLLAESEKFRAKLKDLGKTVDGYTVKGVGHAWDKQPSFLKGNSKRDDAYRLATESLQSSMTQQE